MHAKAKLLNLDQRRRIQLLGLMFIQKDNHVNMSIPRRTLGRPIENCFMYNDSIIVNIRIAFIIKVLKIGKHYQLILHEVPRCLTSKCVLRDYIRVIKMNIRYRCAVIIYILTIYIIK